MVSCDWIGGMDGVLETTCGHAFELNDGTPTENGMKFCCYCGQVLTYVPASSAYDEEDEADMVQQQERDEVSRD